jgi:hypothetical protein
MLGVIVVLFVLRTVLVAILRVEQMPRAAAAVDRWWVWAPLVLITGGTWWYLGPLVGAAAAVVAIGLVVYHQRQFGELSSGSPR